jgi:hypothetical protein
MTGPLCQTAVSTVSMLPQTGHLCVRRSLPGLWGTMNATNIRLPRREHNGGFTFSVVVMHPSGDAVLRQPNGPG